MWDVMEGSEKREREKENQRGRQTDRQIGDRENYYAYTVKGMPPVTDFF